MKARSLLSISFIFFLIFLFNSCEDKKEDHRPQPEKGKGKNEYINGWIYDKMSKFYYWNYTMLPENKLDRSQEPTDFYRSILFNRDQRYGDRFSYIDQRTDIKTRTEHLYAKDGIRPSEVGFEYYTFGDSGGPHVYMIVFVKKGTHAAKEKLKRGDVIVSVDGTDITEYNYSKLLRAGKSSYTLTLESGETKKINVETNYPEDPLYYHGIIDKKNEGKKIGYVLYNFFANDKGDNSMSYALAINDVFKQFQTAQITDLVLDLRYNPGGLVEAGTYIASAIVPNRVNKMTYTKHEYNEKYDKELQAALKGDKYIDFINNYFSNHIYVGRKSDPIAKLGISKLYVLTSKYTASASEQIINGLRAYMDVEVIGETTIGKNYESTEFTDNNSDNNWMIQPLISKSLDKKDKSDYELGFPPTSGIELDEFETIREGKALFQIGDEEETLLRAAIARITKSSIIKSKPQKVKRLHIAGSSIQEKSNAMLIDIKQNTKE